MCGTEPVEVTLERAESLNRRLHERVRTLREALGRFLELHACNDQRDYLAAFDAKHKIPKAPCYRYGFLVSSAQAAMEATKEGCGEDIDALEASRAEVAALAKERGEARSELDLLRDLERLYRGTAMPSREMNRVAHELDALRSGEAGKDGEA